MPVKYKHLSNIIRMELLKMKPIIWLGNTYQTIKDYSDIVRQEIGYNLDKV